MASNQMISNPASCFLSQMGFPYHWGKNMSRIFVNLTWVDTQEEQIFCGRGRIPVTVDENIALYLQGLERLSSMGNIHRPLIDKEGGLFLREGGAKWEKRRSGEGAI
jgi:hypothetical protein